MREYTHIPMDGCMCATSEWLTICIPIRNSDREVLIDNLEIYREYIPCARWHCSIQSSIERIVANRINEIQH